MPRSEQTSPAVSVIVPTYNRAGFLAECLDALLAQLTCNDQVIVVNDGSTDGTADILSRYVDRVRVIEQENAGKAAALNRGLLHVDNGLVWIVDDDDVVAPYARDRLVAALAGAPDAGFAYGRHDRFIEDVATGTRQVLGTGYWVDCPPEEFLVHTLEDMFPHQPGMIVRKSLYDKVGPFETECDRSEDYEMLIRLAVESLPVAVPGIVFHQRIHGGIRGRGTDPVTADKRDANWIDIGRLIARTSIASLPLEYFLPGREIRHDADRRRALLQRGVVFGRHHLWDSALEEFEQAERIGQGPLTEQEKRTLMRMSCSKFGVGELAGNPAILNRFKALADRSAAGADLCRTAGRSLRWRIREAATSGHVGQAIRLLQTSLSLSRAARPSRTYTTAGQKAKLI